MGLKNNRYGVPTRPRRVRDEDECHGDRQLAQRGHSSPFLPKSSGCASTPPDRVTKNGETLHCRASWLSNCVTSAGRSTDAPGCGTRRKLRKSAAAQSASTVLNAAAIRAKTISKMILLPRAARSCACDGRGGHEHRHPLHYEGSADPPQCEEGASQGQRTRHRAGDARVAQ
jgi:hypothetical protein